MRTAMAQHAPTSAAGQRWLPWFADIFARGRDVRAWDCAALVLQLAAGAGDALNGRFSLCAMIYTRLRRGGGCPEGADNLVLRLTT